MGNFYFTLKAKKGKAAISKCKVEAETNSTGSGQEPITILPPNESGSGPLPATGAGSEPVLPFGPVEPVMDK